MRHYTDGSDNPGWVDKTVGATTATTRYTGSIGGDLGASTTGTGRPQLSIADLHGDVATTIDLPATGNATSISAWADYDEYGQPKGTPVTREPAGYGWLGAKERATSADTANLTLMGDRLYNAARGLFTSTDPEPGGNDNAYTYPNDPINKYDLNGHWGLRKAFWGVVRFFSARSYISAAGYASKFDGRGMTSELFPEAAKDVAYARGSKSVGKRWGRAWAKHSLRTYGARAVRFGARGVVRSAGFPVTAVATGLDYYHSKPTWRPRQHMREMRTAWGRPVNAAMSWATSKFWQRARGAY